MSDPKRKVKSNAKTSIDLGLAVLASVRGRTGFRGELTPTDIAEVCGCSKKMIQNIQASALEKMRKRLAREHFTAADMLGDIPHPAPRQPKP